VHVAELLRAAVDGPVVAVAAPDQAVPALPPGVELVRDAAPDEGPLRGLEAGLTALAGRADGAFAAAVDLPLLAPALVRALLGLLDADTQAAVPVVDGLPQPLAAAYRVDALQAVRALLAAGERRASALVDALDARRLDRSVLLGLPGVAEVDPDLRSLVGANTPAAYERLRAGS
jgi:molybdopterin-guanine dinucleotide biosynthesis protein A